MIPSSLDVESNKVHTHAPWRILCEQVPCDLNIKNKGLVTLDYRVKLKWTQFDLMCEQINT